MRLPDALDAHNLLRVNDTHLVLVDGYPAESKRVWMHELGTEVNVGINTILTLNILILLNKCNPKFSTIYSYVNFCCQYESLLLNFILLSVGLDSLAGRVGGTLLCLCWSCH